MEKRLYDVTSVSKDLGVIEVTQVRADSASDALRLVYPDMAIRFATPGGSYATTMTTIIDAMDDKEMWPYAYAEEL